MKQSRLYLHNYYINKFDYLDKSLSIFNLVNLKKPRIIIKNKLMFLQLELQQLVFILLLEYFGNQKSFMHKSSIKVTPKITLRGFKFYYILDIFLNESFLCDESRFKINSISIINNLSLLISNNLLENLQLFLRSQAFDILFFPDYFINNKYCKANYWIP